MGKKIGIITHYNVHNHGAHLQMYALIKVLENMGYNASALQYNKNYDFMQSNANKKYNISLKSIPLYIKYLFKNGFGCTLYNVKKRRLLKKFRDENTLVGEYYSKTKDLDAVVIGSDEIFSIEPGLNPCFFGMGVPCEKIISYAASFGPTTQGFIAENHAKEFVCAGLSHIDNISVRDKNSQEIVNALTGDMPQLVCDPVILYGYQQEQEKRRETRKKYLLIYSYDKTLNDKDSVSKIKAYAKRKGLKIYSVGFYHKWCDKNINVKPLDVFSWFSNAEMVITDTFHGAVLSLITNAQLVVKLKENQNKLLWLLKEYALEERIVKDFNELDRVTAKVINFNVVNNLIEKNRGESLKYLKDILS